MKSMNRTIKFRAKVKRNDIMTNPKNGWVYGFYYEDLCNGEVKSFIKGGEMLWEVNPETLGQCTGLSDKNGKDIYEGDILKVTQIRPKFKPNMDLGITVVEFSPWWGWRVGTQYDRYAFDPANPIDTLEIIGNIHDNKHLIEPNEE